MSVQAIPVILLSRNNPSQLRRCVESVHASTRYTYTLHVVDNNSSDPEQLELLDRLEMSGVTVWREPDNRWVLGLNRCLRALACSTSAYYLISDADIIFPQLEGPCWLERLVDTMNRYPFIGKLGTGLSLENIRDKPHMASVLEREKLYNSIELTPEVYLALVDTTAALYRPDMFVWETFRFYPGHGSAMKPYYYAGRHKGVTAYHLGWDEDEYSAQGVSNSRYIDEKVNCFALYGGFADPVTLRSVSWKTALLYRVVSPLARAFWGGRLLLHWLLYMVRGRLIRINQLMNRVR